MNVSRLTFALVLSFAVAGCSSISETSAPDLPMDAVLNQGNGVVLHVQGAGYVDLSAAAAGEAKFQFVAHKKADGSVSGHFRQERSSASGTVDFNGVVTCLTIDPMFPGRARIGGRVTANNSTHPGFLTENHEVGDDVWFRVEDGSLTGGVDRSTTYGFKPTLVETSEQYCALPFDGLPWWNPASTFPLAQGTIRVKS
jgi:hypothetical protein